MPETTMKCEPMTVEKDNGTSTVSFQPPRLETFNIPGSHEERLAWVRKSYERFFEKVLEIDAMLGLPELN